VKHLCAPRSSSPTAFTLVELLVVIALVGLLVALLLPAVQAARESSRRSACQDRLRQLGVGIVTHEAALRAFPIGCIGCRFVTAAAGQPVQRQQFLSWNIQLLPYLEEAPLAARFDLKVPSYVSPNREAGATVLPLFLCPSTPEDVLLNTTGLWRGMAFTDYAGLYGVEGVGRSNTDPNSLHWLDAPYLGPMLYEEPTRAVQITDGLSRTALIGECLARRVTENEWANGNNLFAQEGSTPINQRSGLGNEIGSPHPQGASVVFCDGHVEFLQEDMEQGMLNALLTRAGGELAAE
jgi:prepilin-type processing-associated H-X9-DG protein